MRQFDDLAPALKDSIRDIVDDIPNKLEVVGLNLRATPGRPTPWPADQATLDLLAEMERGPYTAERLLRGWRSGDRDTGRFLSPHLVPWAELKDEYREWDRAIIQDLPTAVGEAGYGAS